MRATHSAAVISILALSALAPEAHASTLTLDKTLVLVYQNNPALAAARAKLRATDELVAQAMGGWRPTLSATADDGTSRQSMSGNGTAPVSKSLNTRDVSVNFKQPLFSGFKTVSGVHSAEDTVQAQQASLQDTEQQVFLDAAKAYLGVVEAQNILKLDRQSEHVLWRRLKEVKDRVRIQDLSKTDLAQARSRLESARVARLQAERQLSDIRQTFKQIVGEMPGVLKMPRPDYAIPKTQNDAITLAMRYNPSVIAARYSQHAAREDITSAEGNMLPSLDLVGNASRQLDQSPITPSQSNNATIEVRLTVPLYGAGVNYSKAREAEDTAQQKQMQLTDANNKVMEQTANAWQAYQTAREARRGDQSLVRAEDAAYRGVELEEKYGSRTTLDVLNAEQERLNAKISLARAAHDEILALMQLKAATGKLTASALNLPVKKYDPNKYYRKVRGKWFGLATAKE